MSRTPAVSIIVTIAAAAAALARLWWPTLTIDSITIVLLLIAVVPWLAPIIKSLEVPGWFKLEWQNQGVTTSPPLPQATASPPKSLSADSRKVLATLWQHQRKHFGDDYSKRWTFAVAPGSMDFSNYLSGVAELVKSGLVSVTEKWHSVLTNPGIEFAKKDPSLDTEPDVYRF